MLSYKTSLIVIATMCNILLPIDSYIILEASNTNYSRSNVPILTQIKPVPSVSDTLERSNFTIKRFAAIGDSYATGVGNGQRVDRKCRRYDQAYGYLINDEIRARNGFTDDSKSSFQFLACVGDTVQSVSKTQLSQMEGRFDAMTLTIGGNDIRFNRLVNNCIFGWIVKPIYRCEKTVKRSFRQIKDFGVRLDGLLVQIREMLTPDTGRIYITGYAKMFNADTSQCDVVSWALWGAKKPLLRNRRRMFNDLANALNAEIESAADRAGPQVVYVDYDAEFGICKGRICEPGVIEPAPGRASLLFYEKDGPPVALPPPSVSNITLFEDRSIAKLIPDTLMRTCHPRANAHRIIADLILWHMDVEEAKYMGYQLPPRPGPEICQLELAGDTVDYEIPRTKSTPMSDYLDLDILAGSGDDDY